MEENPDKKQIIRDLSQIFSVSSLGLPLSEAIIEAREYLRVNSHH
jgi:hypothetical protein